jgi:hypothetical protein
VLFGPTVDVCVVVLVTVGSGSGGFDTWSFAPVYQM